MNKATTSTLVQQSTKSILFDILALLFIYFVPALSHLSGLPIYYAEPMRIMLILALVYTNKQNAYILAVTLPLFSYIISAHPVLPKMLLITFELVLNVFLFYLLSKKFKQIFWPILISIIGSKMIYYILKYFLIETTILKSELVSTPIYIQIITTLVLSFYVFGFFRKQR